VGTQGGTVPFATVPAGNDLLPPQVFDSGWVLFLLPLSTRPANTAACFIDMSASRPSCSRVTESLDFWKDGIPTEGKDISRPARDCSGTLLAEDSHPLLPFVPQRSSSLFSYCPSRTSR